MDQMVNHIWLVWQLTCILRTYRICNATVKFTKYELNNKLMSNVTLVKIIPNVTWTQPIYIIEATDPMWDSTLSIFLKFIMSKWIFPVKNSII